MIYDTSYTRLCVGPSIFNLVEDPSVRINTIMMVFTDGAIAHPHPFKVKFVPRQGAPSRGVSARVNKGVPDSVHICTLYSSHNPVPSEWQSYGSTVSFRNKHSNIRLAEYQNLKWACKPRPQSAMDADEAGASEHHAGNQFQTLTGMT